MKLTLETAEAIVNGGQQRAAELGLQLCFAVVDNGGHLVALARMDGAYPMSPRVAGSKAYTAAILQRTSAEYGQVIDDNPNFAAVLAALSDRTLVASGGGLPIIQNKIAVGGAGASGGTTEQDIECIRAGFALANIA